MKKRLIPVIAALSLMASQGPALAHHAFSSEFDANAPVHLTGKVSKVAWVNPHAWIYVDVKTADGSMTTWAIEGGTPNNLFRHGINKDSLQVGTDIVVEGYQAKDKSNRANGRDLTLPSGQKLFMGSSGTGAPYDTKTNPAQ